VRCLRQGVRGVPRGLTPVREGDLRDERAGAAIAYSASTICSTGWMHGPLIEAASGGSVGRGGPRVNEDVRECFT
jgi:hypothetical protein